MAHAARSALIGFVAAAVAVVFVHQAIVFVLNAAGLWDKVPWSTAPVPPWGVPTILNSVFWGGLWGALLGLLYAWLPGRQTWLKGLLYGWGIFLLSNCLLVPWIKGQPLFYGNDPAKLLPVFLILSGFGMATAIIYRALAERS